MPKETASAVVDQPTTGTTDSQVTDQAATGTAGVGDTTQTSQQTDEAAGATDDTAEDIATELISQERYDALKDDPATLRKELNKAATQKFQQLAKERKALGNWAEIRDAFTEDAPAAIKALASQLGLEIRDPKADVVVAATTNAGDAAVDKLKEALGKVGLEELADTLGPVIREIAETAAGKATEPIKTHQEKLINESAERESKATLDAFGKQHPGWEKHEPAMVALSKKFQPGVDKDGKALMSETDYLEQLYFLVTKDQQIAKAAQDAIDRMTKGAAAADTTSTTVTGDKVTARPPGKGGFREAYAAAKRGERWE